MSRTKLKNLYAQRKQSLKKPRTSNGENQKVEINNLINLINKKLKDPNLAKKAALLIEELLKKNSK